MNILRQIEEAYAQYANKYAVAASPLTHLYLSPADMAKLKQTLATDAHIDVTQIGSINTVSSEIFGTLMVAEDTQSYITVANVRLVDDVVTVTTERKNVGKYAFVDQYLIRLDQYKNAAVSIDKELREEVRDDLTMKRQMQPMQYVGPRMININQLEGTKNDWSKFAEGLNELLKAINQPEEKSKGGWLIVDDIEEEKGLAISPRLRMKYNRKVQTYTASLDHGLGDHPGKNEADGATIQEALRNLANNVDLTYGTQSEQLTPRAAIIAAVREFSRDNRGHMHALSGQDVKRWAQQFATEKGY
jgi:hypothetical protein